MERDGNLQNEFFNGLRKERALVAVYLANGKRLVGRIKGFDRFTILLEGAHGDQVVFKHAVSTVGPMRHGTAIQGEVEGPVGDQAAAYPAAETE